MSNISSLAQSLLHIPFSSAEKISWTSLRESYSNISYNDIFFAILFISNWIIVVCYGFFVGIHAISLMDDFSFVTIASDSSISTSSEHSSDFLGGIFLALGLGIAISISLTSILAKISSQLINATIALTGSLALVVGVVLFTLGYLVGGILLILLAIFCCLFYMYMKTYIKFASVILKIACQALEHLPSLYLVAAVVLLFQAFFCVMWLLTAIGAATNESSSSIYVNGVKYPMEDCVSYTYSSVSFSIATYCLSVCLTDLLLFV